MNSQTQQSVPRTTIMGNDTYVDTPGVLSHSNSLASERPRTANSEVPTYNSRYRTHSIIPPTMRPLAKTCQYNDHHWLSPLANVCLTGTQKDQNEEDEAARKNAVKELVTSWNDRLTSISVIVSALKHVITILHSYLCLDNVLRSH